VLAYQGCPRKKVAVEILLILIVSGHKMASTNLAKTQKVKPQKDTQSSINYEWQKNQHLI